MAVRTARGGLSVRVNPVNPAFFPYARGVPMVRMFIGHVTANALWRKYQLNQTFTEIGARRVGAISALFSALTPKRRFFGAYNHPSTSPFAWFL
jgi:hypothetical protein